MADVPDGDPPTIAMSSTPSASTLPEDPERKRSDARNSLGDITAVHDSSNGLGSSSKSSQTRSRHISLQSRVDSIAGISNTNHSVYMAGYSSDEAASMPDMRQAHRLSTYDYQSQGYIVDDPLEYNRRPEATETPTMELETEPEPEPPMEEMSKFQEVMFVGVVASGYFCAQFGLGMTLAPVDIISQSFGTTNPAEQSWMIAEYCLTIGTFVLLAIRIGDIVGHKRMLAFGYVWFGLWSALAGFSIFPRSHIFFHFSRALQGIGPAIIIPNGIALFGRAYAPGMRKNMVFSIFGVVAPAGFVLGATFGALYAQVAWWPWAFWSFAIVLWALALVTILFAPRELRKKPVSRPEFDRIGALLSIVGLLLLGAAWNNGPLYGWTTPQVYFVLIIGLLCTIIFILVERRADNPIFPLSIMNGTVSLILGCMAFGWGAVSIWFFYSFRFLAQIRLSSPLSTAAQFTPLLLCGLLAAIFTGFMLMHTPISFVMLMSMTAFTISIIIAATMPPNQSYWAQMFISVLIMPFGMDMSLPAASIILSKHMPSEHQGLAMPLVYSVVNYSMAIALGIAGTVQSNLVPEMSTPDEVLNGFRYAFYCSVGMSIAGVICSTLYFLRSMVKEGWHVAEH